MARGYIRKRGTNRWQLTWDVPRGPDGKRQQRYETMHGTKKQADARMAEIEHDLNRGIYTEPSKMLLSDYLDTWLRDVSMRHRETTKAHHEYIVRVHIKPKIGSIPLAQLTTMDIQSLYIEKLESGLSTQTVIHIHRTIHQALGQAVHWDLLHRNVAERANPPRLVKRPGKYLNVHEVHVLLSAAQVTDYYLPIHLAIYTGLRRSEILGLRRQDIDLSKGEITVNQTVVLARNKPVVDEPKTKCSRRTISMDPNTVEIMRSHYERIRSAPSAPKNTPRPQDRVCVRPAGTPIKPPTLSKGYDRIAQRCDISGVTFHGLRHTHATMLLDSNVPIHTVQGRMGHASIQTTVDIYGHVLPASAAAAADALMDILDENSTD